MSNTLRFDDRVDEHFDRKLLSRPAPMLIHNMFGGGHVDTPYLSFLGLERYVVNLRSCERMFPILEKILEKSPREEFKKYLATIKKKPKKQPGDYGCLTLKKPSLF